MDTISKVAVAVLGGISVVTLGVFIALLVGPLLGALAGAIFAWVFPETAFALLVALNMPIQFWQLGALAGFFGGFLRAKSATVKAS